MKNVSLIRDDEYILNNINWKVKEREHWAVLGLNGSGKTTLLNIINGYIFPSKGDVTILGETFGQSDLRELRKSIGVVSSSLQDRLYKEECAQDVVLSGKFSTIGLYDETEEKDLIHALNLLKQLNCIQIARKPYKILSQGEKQKVLIARALFNNPKLLILDEPCTGLDIISREKLLETVSMLSLDKDGPTLIYVTHRVEEILPAFTKTLLLKKGKIHSKGETEKLLTDKNLTDFYDINVQILNHKNTRILRLTN